MTTQGELYRRAGALCIAAEPHEGITDWPCRTHLDEARRQLSAVASTVTGSPAAAGAVDGAAGTLVSSPAVTGGPTLAMRNRPGTVNPRAAEGATVIARNESMA